MTTSPRVRQAVEKFHAQQAQVHEPRHSAAVGVVSSVSRNAAGQVMKATVTLTSNGTTIPNLDAGGRHGMGVGARVLLDGVGSKAATAWKIDTVLDQAPGTPGTGAGEIVSTPIHAFIESAIVTAFAATAIISAEFGFYLISEQWQYNQAIAYELEVRDATSLQNAYRTTTQFYRRIAGQVKTAIDDNDTTLEVQSNGQSNPYSEFDHTNGIALLENELVRYESTDEPGAYIRLLNLERGYASTAAASHDVGASATWRGMSIPIPNLVQDTLYECHVRAINAAGNASNWSDWESFSTAGGVTSAEDRTADLITNGTFNSNTTGWSLGGVHSASLSHTAAVGLRGLGAARIEETGVAFPTSPQLTQGTISVTGGREYVVQLYAAGGGDLSPTGTTRLNLSFNTGNTDYASPLVAVQQAGDIATNKWVMFEARGVAPFGATSATVSLFLSGWVDDGEDGEFYIDDVRMWELEHTKDALIEEAVESDTLTVGGGGTVTALLYGSKTWDPPSVALGARTSTTVTVTGAALGDSVIGLGLTTLNTGEAVLRGVVSATDTVTVFLENLTGVSGVDYGSGTLVAWVLKGTA